MTDERSTPREPEQPVPPPRGRRHQSPAHPGPSDEGGEDTAADERTSPSPYAEKFDEWVADETAAPDGRQDRSAAGDADG